jgi:hypothetical protein
LAASFGLNLKDFTKDELSTKENIELMKHALASFDYVSTRETSGVELCKTIFKTKAQMILDPVFFPSANIYENIMKDSQVNVKNKIVTYVLDTSEQYKKVLESLEKNGEIIYNLNINKNSVSDWIKAIKECKFLITDSFHGTCFAIIFNKPFVCIRNKARGDARFESLIDLFNIKNNFVENIEDLNNIEKYKTDYYEINDILSAEKDRCINTIKLVLSGDLTTNPEAFKFKKQNEKFLHHRMIMKNKSAYRKYLKCKILSKLTFGKKKKHYSDKKLKIKKEMEINNYET